MSNTVKEEVVDKEEVKEETVSKKDYETLYNQAVELQQRYEKLAKIYNLVLENFLSGK